MGQVRLDLSNWKKVPTFCSQRHSVLIGFLSFNMKHFQYYQPIDQVHWVVIYCCRKCVFMSLPPPPCVNILLERTRSWKMCSVATVAKSFFFLRQTQKVTFASKCFFPLVIETVVVNSPSKRVKKSFASSKSFIFNPEKSNDVIYWRPLNVVNRFFRNEELKFTQNRNFIHRCHYSTSLIIWPQEVNQLRKQNFCFSTFWHLLASLKLQYCCNFHHKNAGLQF